MLSILPDLIERMPKGCNECPFAYYDEHNGAAFFCGLSRFTIDKQRKQKVRHKGCGLFDPDYSEDDQEQPKKDPVLDDRPKTNQDIANDIISRAKELATSLREGDYEELEELENIEVDFDEVTEQEEDEQDGEYGDDTTEEI